MRVAFYTLGCKVNHYETEVMAQAFARAGDMIVPFEDEADVFVVNTCTVTAVSDQKSRQMLRQARRRCPEAVVVAVGCYAQVAAEELAALPEVDLLLGNVNKPRLPALVRDFRAGRPIPQIPDIGKLQQFEPMEASTSDRTRATIKIQDGCNNFCTYCMIPYARGRIRSKPPQGALREFRGLLRRGYREIVLTGIEIASYGGGAGEDFSLLELLREMAAQAEAAPGLRVRLGSLEPRIVTEEFAAALADMPFVCPQFHLSLQSGCDSVLRRMNRHYDMARYRLSAELLRRYIPDVMLTTDIIVAFPGESEQEFMETVQAARELEFLKVHVFPYSRRKGTPAAGYEGQHSKAEKSRRVALLSQACDGVRVSLLQRQLGSQTTLLLEDWRGGVYHGYTPNYLPVQLEAPPGLSGQILPVTITGVGEDILLAKAVQQPL